MSLSRRIAILTAALALLPAVAHAQSFNKVTASVLNGPSAIKGDYKVCFTESPLPRGAVIQYEVTGASGCGPVDYFFVLTANNKGAVGQCVNVSGCPAYAGMVLKDDTNGVSVSF